MKSMLHTRRGFRSRFFPALILMLVLSLMLAACSSGSGGSTGTSGSSASSGSGQKPVVRISGEGGSFQDCVKQTLTDPFAAKSGIDIVFTSGADLGKLRTEMEANNVEWDLVEMTASMYGPSIKEGWLAPLDFNIVTNAGDLVDGAKDTYGVGVYYYSTLIAFNTDKYPAGQEPQGWADFFDVQNFPGPRSMYTRAEVNLEAALLADGVPPDQLYPLDVDRAIRKLNELKPNIKVFYDSGAQIVENLSSAETWIQTAWNGRIYAAAKEGRPVGMTYNQGILDFARYVVLSSSPNKEAAMQVLNAMIDPEAQAKFAECIGYGPANQKAFDHLSVDVAKQLPTYPDNFAKQILINSEWWDEHGLETQERYVQWRSGT